MTNAFKVAKYTHVSIIILHLHMLMDEASRSTDLLCRSLIMRYLHTCTAEWADPCVYTKLVFTCNAPRSESTKRVHLICSSVYIYRILRSISTGTSIRKLRIFAVPTAQGTYNHGVLFIEIKMQ